MKFRTGSDISNKRKLQANVEDLNRAIQELEHQKNDLLLQEKSMVKQNKEQKKQILGLVKTNQNVRKSLTKS